MSVLSPPEARREYACGIGADQPFLPGDASWSDGLFRRAVKRRLAGLVGGVLTIVDGKHYTEFGNGGELRTTVNVCHPRFYRRIALDGAIGAAESYIDGDWTTDDLLALVRLFARSEAVSAQLDRVGPIASLAATLPHWWRLNTRSNSRRNIAAHYDLGNEFFALFLDDTMTYSCGVFGTPCATMHAASIAKFDQLCQKLQLSPDDHLVEIGTGWGGLAIHAAEKYGCRVTTTTISARQFHHVKQLIAARGLADRITVLNDDYRDLTGQFDKLVSVEMIEAVGHEFLPTFFRKCDGLLKPGGLAAIQTITIPDERYEGYRRRVDFIQKYIFPGGCLPSLAVLSRAIGRHTDLRMMHEEDLSQHYAMTLDRWRDEFWRNVDAVRALGLPEPFIRMWDWYFCYCEGAYRERQIGLAQLLLAKP